MDPADRLALLVLGMHRSGTSALTRIVNLLGAELGENLLPAHPDNETGFWEHRDVVVLHDELLAALGTSWDDPRPIAEEDLRGPIAEPYRDRLRELLVRDFETAPCFAIKDPRLCRLLPLWLPLLEELKVRTACILVGRHPDEVAASLDRRNEVADANARLLWLGHVLSSEWHSRHLPRAFVTFDGLLRDWRAEMRRVGQALELDWEAAIRRAGAEVDAFLDGSLRHHASAEEDPAGGPWIERAWSAFRAGARGEVVRAGAALDRVAREVDVAGELFFPLARDAAEWRGKARERGRQVLELRRRKEKEKQEEEARSGEAGDRAVRDAADAIRDDAGEAPATASPARTVPAGRLLRTYDATEDAPAAVSTAASPDELTSIIVLTRNGVEDTRLCLDSIATHTDAPHEVIVVDNGSTDGTLDHLRWRLARTGNLRVVRNAANRGFAAGINLGLAIAHGARIVLLNNDTVVTPGWLGGLAAVLDENDDCGVVGPMTNHASGPQVVANVPYRTLAGMQEFALDWTCRHSGSEVARRLVGFCWMMRREVVDEIGGLDERFGTGNCEDDDYCLRVHQAGWKTRIARGVFVHHTGSRTFRSENIDYDAQLRKNFEVFRSKWRLGPEASVEKPYPFLEIVKGPAQPRVRLPEIAGTHQLCERGRWHRDRHPGANAAVAADETTGEMVDRTFRLAVGVLPGGQLTRETRALFERYGFREEPPAWETTAHIAAQLRDKPLVLMLGPDVVVPDDALQEMLEVLREHDDVAGVGPVSNAAPPGQRDRPGYGDVGRELRRFATRRRRQRRGQVKSVTHLGGFCLLLRGAAIREVGGLDESLPIEDALLDLFERLRGAGRRVVVASGAWVHQARPTPVEGAAYGTRETHKSGVDG